MRVEEEVLKGRSIRRSGRKTLVSMTPGRVLAVGLGTEKNNAPRRTEEGGLQTKGEIVFIRETMTLNLAFGPLIGNITGNGRSEGKGKE